MTKLRPPVPFKRPGRGQLPGQSDYDSTSLSDTIVLKVIDRPSATIINREVIQIGNVGGGKFVEIDLTGIKLHTNTLQKLYLDSDGDVFLGTDISSPSSTHLAIFATDQTYNSEAMTAGDMLLGDNTAGAANIFWDASEGQMFLRTGTTITQLLDSDGDFFLGSDTSDPDLTFLAFFANNQTYNSEAVEVGDLLLGSNSAGKPNVFWDASAGQMSFRLGTTDNLSMDSNGTIISQSNVTKVDIAADGDVFLGSDTSSPDSTALSIFAGDQTYNSEVVQANDILFGSNSADQPNMFWDESAGQFLMRLGTNNTITMDSDGTILSAGNIQKIDLVQAGDLFVGRDTTDPDTTALAIFANGQTYNSEVMGAGDILIGSNSAGQHNLFWDDSAGEFLLREGTNKHIELDDAKLYLGDTAGQNILLSATSGISFREGTTSYGQLTGSAIRLGQAGFENIRITGTELEIKDSATVYSSLSSGIWTIGRTSQEHIRIGGTSLQIKDGATIYTSLGAGEIVVGVSSAENIRMTGSELQIRDGGTVYTELSSGTITVGRTSSDHVEIASNAVRIKDSGVVRGEWQTDGDIFIGSDISNPDDTYLSIFAGAQTYNSESVQAGDMLIGDNSSSKANILWDKSAARLNFRGGTTTQLYIDTDGSLVAGGGDVTLDSDGIYLVSGSGNTNKYRIRDSSDTILDISSQVTSNTSTSIFLSEGKNSSNHEAMFQMKALTDDGSAHSGTGVVTLTGDTTTGWIVLSCDVLSVPKVLRLAGMTSGTIGGLSPTAGWMVYNSTTNKFQGYNGSSWVDFH